MALYRSKPVEIEAVFFNGTNADEIKAFCLVESEHHFHLLGDEERPLDSDIIARVYDKLHDTWVGVKSGQYIIKGTKGEFYPCDLEVFNTKYEEVA